MNDEPIQKNLPCLPGFPSPTDKQRLEYWRWHFAGHAFEGLLARGRYDEKDTAHRARVCADILIEELQKGQL